MLRPNSVRETVHSLLHVDLYGGPPPRATPIASRLSGRVQWVLSSSSQDDGWWLIIDSARLVECQYTGSTSSHHLTK